MQFSLRSLANKFIVEKTDHIFIQLFRYFFVSGFSLIVDFSTLFIFTSIIGIHYLISTVLSYSIGLFVNYMISVAWVFHTRRIQNPRAEFFIFAIIGILGLGLNVLIMWVWTGLLGFFYLAGRIVSAAIGYVWKYFARRFILFSSKPDLSSSRNSIGQQANTEELQ